MVGASEEGERLGQRWGTSPTPPPPDQSTACTSRSRVPSGLAPKGEALVLFAIIILTGTTFMFYVQSTSCNVWHTGSAAAITMKLAGFTHLLCTRHFMVILSFNL